MDQARFCPKCGHALNQDERFCPNCGYDCGGKEEKEAKREEDRYQKERKGMTGTGHSIPIPHS